MNLQLALYGRNPTKRAFYYYSPNLAVCSGVSADNDGMSGLYIERWHENPFSISVYMSRVKNKYASRDYQCLPNKIIKKRNKLMSKIHTQK